MRKPVNRWAKTRQRTTGRRSPKGNGSGFESLPEHQLGISALGWISTTVWGPKLGFQFLGGSKPSISLLVISGLAPWRT
jgi:hypothetical protein